LSLESWVADFALQHFVKADFHVWRKFHVLGIAEYIDGQFCLTYDQHAVSAALQMLLDFQLQSGVQVAVDVVRDLEDYAIAVQFGFLSRM
jgi:hypothetical protein